MQSSHIFSRCSIDLCAAPYYLNIRQDRETLAHLCVAIPLRGAAGWADQMERHMGFTFFRKYFRSRNVYWNVMRELASYSDRELHDLGIDRADVPQIARQAAAQA